MRTHLARPRAIRLLGAALALALLITACGDRAATEDAATSDLSMSDDAGADGHHDLHDVIEVPDAMTVPIVGLRAEADSTSGTNLFIEVEDFTITPENASTRPVDGEGHFHLYIDGERVMRFYNQALQITGLDAGEHEISVEVSANNHAAYAVDGVAIRATETITVDESEQHAIHGMTDVEAESAPAVDLTVTEDPSSGWNLQVELTDFAIAPEKVGGAHVEGEGHLHLYVDGERITRLYGRWWHLAELTEGPHEISVQLSGNDHSVYSIGGEAITASITVQVSADRASAGADPAPDQNEMEARADGEGTVAIDISVANGDVETASGRVEVDLGSEVIVSIDSDVPDEVHVHGYDLVADVAAGSAAEIAFTADIPGVFEIELEEAGLLLLEIAVG